jgi:hypothetical protein
MVQSLVSDLPEAKGSLTVGQREFLRDLLGTPSGKVMSDRQLAEELLRLVRRLSGEVGSSDNQEVASKPPEVGEQRSDRVRQDQGRAGGSPESSVLTSVAELDPLGSQLSAREVKFYHQVITEMLEAYGLARRQAQRSDEQERIQRNEEGWNDHEVVDDLRGVLAALGVPAVLVERITALQPALQYLASLHDWNPDNVVSELRSLGYLSELSTEHLR